MCFIEISNFWPGSEAWLRCRLAFSKAAYFVHLWPQSAASGAAIYLGTTLTRNHRLQISQGRCTWQAVPAYTPKGQGLKENFVGNNGADEDAHDSDDKCQW